MMTMIALLLLSSPAAFAATEEQVNRTFPASSGGTLVVDVDFGSIDVTTGGANREVSVNVWRRVTRRNRAEEERFLREHPIELLHEGNTVTVRCRSKEWLPWFRAWTRWFGGWLNRNEGKLTILVPTRFDARLNTSGDGVAVSDLAGNVTAGTSGGRLSFVRVHGPLDGVTSGGSIRITDCEGAIRARTSGGHIEVVGGGGSLDGETSGGRVSVGPFAGPVSIKTSGGGITIKNVRGSVKGSTSGGRIDAALPTPIPGDVTLSTSGGGVTVEVAERASFNLDAQTIGGGVTCDLPVTLQGQIGHGRVKGVVNAGGPAVVLRTSGGSIHVKRE
jgi:DUF4097 and DUF4098 domain-containing protein YvlB